MAESLKDLMVAAKAAVPEITPDEAERMMSDGQTIVIDVRETSEVEASGKVKDAIHIPRGLLEFRADPDSPMHLPELAKDKSVILYCASGGRSALAGKTLKDMGYDKVHNLGGFNVWAHAGKPIDPGTNYELTSD